MKTMKVSEHIHSIDPNRVLFFRHKTVETAQAMFRRIVAPPISAACRVHVFFRPFLIVNLFAEHVSRKPMEKVDSNHEYILQSSNNYRLILVSYVYLPSKI